MNNMDHSIDEMNANLADSFGKNAVALKEQKSNSEEIEIKNAVEQQLNSDELPAADPPLIPALSNGSNADAGKQRVVRLSKLEGQQLFGFCIQEAIGGETIISKIYAGMAASQNQALFVGDVILAVNGVSIANAKHADAVKAIIEAGNVVELEVQRPNLHLELLRAEIQQFIQTNVQSKNGNNGECGFFVWFALFIVIICAFALGGGILIKLSGMAKELEKMQKFELEMLAIKRANASKEQFYLNAEMGWQFGEKIVELENKIAKMKEGTKLKDELENEEKMKEFEVLEQKIGDLDKILGEKIIELEKPTNENFTKLLNGKNEQMDKEINKFGR